MTGRSGPLAAAGDRQMSEKPRLDHIRALAEKHPEMQQFGQANDNQVHDGKTACTHTICQFLALLWNGDRLTLNDVNHLAGMPSNATARDGKPRGMRPEELARFFAATKIPMHIKFDIPFAGLLTRSDRGPVFYGMRYGSAPTMEIHGAAKGPFGFARPPGHAGATQKGIPDIRHAVLLLGFLERRGPDGKLIAVDVFRKEPNHGSPARPEKPPYDRIFAHQAQREYNDYRDRLGMRLYAAVPTQPLKI
jgi:hypothetical protein